MFFAPHGGGGGALDEDKLTGPLLAVLPPPTTPPTVLESPDSDGDAVMLDTFSFDARSMAEFRRIMIVLVCGSMSSRCSLMLCWFKLSRVSVDDEDDEDGDSSFCFGKK